MPTLKEVQDYLSQLGRRRTKLRRQVDEAYLVESDRQWKLYETQDGISRLRQAQDAHDILQGQLDRIVTEYLRVEKIERELLDARGPLPAAPSPFDNYVPFPRNPFPTNSAPPRPPTPPTPPPRPRPRREDCPRPPPQRAPEPTPRPAPTPRNRPQQPRSIAQWREQCAACFADYASIEEFPIPPANSLCRNQACQTEERALSACKCQIRVTLGRVPNLDLKKERIAWHPDKFAVCREDKREEFQEMATEMFCVVMEMHKES